MWWIFALSLFGVLFAGYLSYSKLFSTTCALAEGCSLFLGWPTCFFGFALFLLIFILSCTSLLSNLMLRKAIIAVSFLGILFSGYFSVYEIFFTPLNLLNGASYELFLPSCAYGLIAFIIVFWIAVRK
jgi:hypothetical protein